MRLIVLCFFLILTLIACSKPQVSTDKQKHLEFINASSNYLLINETRYHYLEKGNGQIMLLLHGFPHFSGTWYKQIDAFQEHYKVIAPDNKGYAYSDKPKEIEAYKLSSLTDDMIRFIETLSPTSKIVLVAHDWGAALAFAISQTRPDLIEKLVVINGVPANAFIKVLSQSDSQRERSKYIHKLDGWLAKIAFFVKGSDLLWQGLVKTYEQGHIDESAKKAFLAAWDQKGAAQGAINWYTANIPRFEDIQESDYWPSKTASSTVPTLLIQSKDDPAFTSDAFEIVQEYVTELKIQIIETDSHSPFLDHTEKVNKMISTFIAQP
jgi:pimeloyl-ACP methyl ester carboxylesterase